MSTNLGLCQLVVGSCPWQSFVSAPAMARVKNAGGGPSDEDPRPPPRLPAEVKGKGTKKTTSKKRKFADADTMRAAAVVAIAERVERGGAQSGVRIAEQLSSA